MKKRSISDQCLAKETIKKFWQQEALNRTRTRSEEKINTNAVSPAPSKPTSNRVFSKILRLKPKSLTKNDAARKNSVLIQTTALVDYDNYQELNNKLDMIKQSVLENLNKLKERDVSIQDLEMKADYLNQQALNLNMVSTNLKKQSKLKSKARVRILAIVLAFVGLSPIYSYLLYWGLFDSG